MGPNLTSFGGIIRTGVYGTITLAGSHTLECGVRFDTLIVRGNVRMTNCIGGRVLSESGNMHCSGYARVDSITGDGYLHVGHGLHCTALDFVGTLEGRGCLRCDTTLHFVGTLIGDMDIMARQLDVNSVLNARTVTAHDIRITPFSSMMLSRHGITRYAHISQAGNLTASLVHVECLRCSLLCADTAIIGKGCRIDEVIYQDECQLSPSATVIRIGGRWPPERDLRRA